MTFHSRDVETSGSRVASVLSRFFLRFQSVGLVFIALASLPAWSAETSVATTAGWGSLFQGLLGLIVVLGLLYGFLVLLRRFGGATGQGSGIVKIVGGVMLSPRERLVMVEIKDTWLVLGVASGQVSLLHTLPKPDDAAIGQEMPVPPFAGKLAELLRKPRKD